MMITLRFFLSCLVLGVVPGSVRQLGTAVEVYADLAPRTEPPVLDDSFLHAPTWDDGQAEVAFYEIVLGEVPDGQRGQGYPAISILVKHDFNPSARRKARDDDDVRVTTFQCVQQFTSLGMYKHARIFNAARDDLRLLEQQWTNISWEDVCYVEMARNAEGGLTSLHRCGMDWQAATIGPGVVAFSAPQLPLVIRALDFSATGEQRFHVVLPEGRLVGARAVLEEEESVGTPSGELQCERIRVTYDEFIGYPGGFFNFVGEQELYWRRVHPLRQIVRIESAGPGGLRCTVSLLEEKRLRWWEETDVLSAFEHVEALP